MKKHEPITADGISGVWSVYLDEERKRKGLQPRPIDDVLGTMLVYILADISKLLFDRILCDDDYDQVGELLNLLRGWRESYKGKNHCLRSNIKNVYTLLNAIVEEQSNTTSTSAQKKLTHKMINELRRHI